MVLVDPSEQLMNASVGLLVTVQEVPFTPLLRNTGWEPGQSISAPVGVALLVQGGDAPLIVELCGAQLLISASRTPHRITAVVERTKTNSFWVFMALRLPYTINESQQLL